MEKTTATSDIFNQANKLFIVSDLLKKLPPPYNKTINDLRWHIRLRLGLPVTATMVHSRQGVLR